MSASLKTILVGYDGFDRQEGVPALASALAKEHSARLRLVHVAPEPPKQIWWSASAKAQKLYAAQMDGRRQRLEELVAQAHKKGIEASIEVRYGKPHIEIIRDAMTTGADLVIVNDEPVRRDGKRGFGTVTMKLLRFCPCPVLAKRDLRKFKHRAILAAVDLENVADESGLNHDILAMAATLARRAEGQVTLFHAWALWGAGLLSSQGGMQPEELRQLADDLKRGREQQAKDLVAAPDLKGLDIHVELQQGEVRRLLPSVVAEKKIDIVVMGTVSRSGIAGFVMGNTAERILNELPCSVLAVKPKGFRTPIEPA